MNAKKYIVVSVVAAALIGMTGCSSDSDDAVAGGVSYVPSNSTDVDSYEGANGDNSMLTAGLITVGDALQSRNTYPNGDADWVAVELEAGKEYEFFATNLLHVGDTEIFLYDENGLMLASNDDYMYLDSNIEHVADYNGTHYVQVAALWSENITSYQLGVRERVDADNDGYTPSYDCNDNNNTIYPFATEIAGDGVDNDCSGVDGLASDVVDAYEVDNDLASAKPIAETVGQYYEIQHRHDIYSKMRTIHDVGESDFFSLTIPAHSGAYLVEDSAGLIDYDWFGYDENDAEVINGIATIDEFIQNDTASPLTYKLEVLNWDIFVGWYAPALISIGTDNDGDGHYTFDWDTDCDDTNASIFPYAAEDSDTDGIDQNCDGNDN